MYKGARTFQSVQELGYRLNNQGTGIQFIIGVRYFLNFSTASILALGSTQPPLQSVLGTLFPRIK
jgi:hypothetical protein